MMKFYVSLVGGSLVALGLVGCVELAQSPVGSEEEAWGSAIRQSYPSWKPPRIAPPGIQDNRSKDYVEDAPAPAFDGTAAPASASEDINVTITETPSAATETVEVGVPGNSEVVVKTDLAPADSVPAETVQSAADDAAKDQAKAGGKDIKADAKADAKTDKVDKEIKYIEYTVVAGDSVSIIARKVYKDGRLYYPILKANESLKKNPNRLYPGMKLRIPQL